MGVFPETRLAEHPGGSGKLVQRGGQRRHIRRFESVFAHHARHQFERLAAARGVARAVRVAWSAQRRWSAPVRLRTLAATGKGARSGVVSTGTVATTNGRRSTKRVPRPTSLCTAMLPPNNRASWSLIARPRPVPPKRRAVLSSARWNGSRIAWSRGIAFERAQGFGTGEHGHHAVEHDDVRRVGSDGVQRRLSVMNGPDLETRRFQPEAQEFAKKTVIVGNKDRSH